MRKRFGMVCLLLGIISILISISLVVYNWWEDKNAERVSENILKDVQTIIDDIVTNPPTSVKIEKSPEKMATVEVDGYECIGILSIPVLDLELPVLSDWSYAKLKKAPCLYYGSYYENDFVIAAHNYNSHFGRLTELQAGDIVIFTDVNNVERYYEVVLLETLQKGATKEMITSGFDLSLYTCTLSGVGRITVRCNLVKNA